jgi:hypothetical protein
MAIVALSAAAILYWRHRKPAAVLEQASTGADSVELADAETVETDFVETSAPAPAEENEQ